MKRLNKIIPLLLMMHPLFAQTSTQGHLTIADPILGHRTLTYEKIGEHAVIEGDILIGKIKELSRQSASVVSKINGGHWPHGILPYEIDGKLPYENRLAVLRAIAHWQENTGIRFVELNASNRQNYANSITFVPAGGTLCASYVGKQRERQVIMLSPRCNTMITVHEIGHAIGLWHEQSRADRDAYVRIVWENIQEEHQFNFAQHMMDGEDYGDYDYDSIMHYNAYAFSKNGEKTIVPLLEHIKIGQREHLSEKDIAAIRFMYPEAPYDED